MSNILVTGASDFIGIHLVDRLKEEGHTVLAFDKVPNRFNSPILGDVTSTNFTSILENVDTVYHLAGLVGTAELFDKIVEAEKINVLGTLRLLEAMRKKDVRKIIFVSKPNMWKFNPYTITKENCERYLQMYKEIYGFKTIIAKPFNVYGPRQQISEYRKAIPCFVISALRNNKIEIFGIGNQVMDLIYISDVVEALLLCEKNEPDHPVEIGTGSPLTVNYVAKKIKKMTNSSSEIVHLPMRKGEPSKSNNYANGNMIDLIGYTPETPLNVGLQKTINWYSNRISHFTKIH